MVAISEPMVNKKKVEGYRRLLGFNHCITNIMGRLGVFGGTVVLSLLSKNHEQRITLKVQKNQDIKELYMKNVLLQIDWSYGVVWRTLTMATMVLWRFRTTLHDRIATLQCKRR